MARPILKNQRLNGLNPLAYIGVDSVQPPEFVTFDRPPTTNDNQNFLLGTIWLDIGTNNPPKAENVWMLVSLDSNIAIWIDFAGSGDLLSLSADNVGSVGKVFGDATHNIKLLGTAGVVVTTGNPGSNSITWSLDGSVAQSFPTDAGTAIPAAGVLDIITNQATNNSGATAYFQGASNVVQLNLTDQDRNTTLGQLAGKTTMTGTDNSSLGYNSLHNVTSGSRNTGIGVNSLDSVTTGSDSVAIGYNSGTAYTTTGLNIAIGNGNTGVVGEIGTTRLGTYSGTVSNTFNTFIGYNTGNNTYTLASDQGNTFVGYKVGSAVTTGSANTAMGNIAAFNLTTGQANTLYGNGAGIQITTGQSNVGIGGNALSDTISAGLTTGSDNCAVGTASLSQVVTGSWNTALGTDAGRSYTGAESYNVCIGGNANGLVGETGTTRCGTATGSSNTNNSFYGFSAGNGVYTLATGINNTFIGANSATFFSTANKNSSLGSNTFLVLGTGASNVAVGYNTLPALTTGSFNIAIGDSAGLNIATSGESSNIYLNNNGTATESHVLRIGAGAGTGTQQLNKAFIHGIRGITTGVADAIAVLVDSAGQLGTVSSSRRFKQNIQEMGSLSSSVMNLSPVTFEFKTHPGKIQFGLIAEEVEDVMPCLVAYNEDGLPETVKYHELVPMLLNEIQKLNKRIEDLEKKQNVIQ